MNKPANNQLLGREAKVIKIEKEEKKQNKTPAWLYHKTCRAGKILYTDDEYNECIKQGWVRSPVMIDEVEKVEKLVKKETKKEAKKEPKIKIKG